jgi:hypothetical protein
MWLTALNVSLLLIMLVVLRYIAIAARTIDAGLDSLLHDQGERLRKIECDLERVRQALDSISTRVMPFDGGQKMVKQG